MHRPAHGGHGRATGRPPSHVRLDRCYGEIIEFQDCILKTRRSLGEGGAYDGKLLSDVLAVFLRVVRGWYYREAKAAGYKDVRTGSVTFCQRFGGALNLVSSS